MSYFKDKVVVVTGGTSGLGKLVCLLLAKEGCSIAFCGRSEDKGLQLVKEIEANGGKAFFQKCDVTQKEEIKQFIDNTLAKFNQINFAVNNAGYIGKISNIADYPDDEWEKVIATNLSSYFYSMKLQIPHIQKSGGGAIVNVSSATGLVGFTRNSAYSASKHGIIGLTKSAALEYAKYDIRINAICPGVFETEMADDLFIHTKDPAKSKETLMKSHPIGRFASIEEIANSVVWLLSENSTFITGVALSVDGGLTAQ